MSAQWLILLAALLAMLAAADADARDQSVVGTIALVADPHLSLDARHEQYSENFQRVIDEVNAAQVDVVLLAGDLTQDGDARAMQAFAEMIRQFRAPTWSVAGNHDVGNKPLPDESGLVSPQRLDRHEKLLGPSFFEEQILPGVRLIGINASLLGSELPREQEQWRFLQGALSQRHEGTTLLLSHYPPFIQHPEEADDYFNINRSQRVRLLEMIDRGGVNAVLSGHLHRPLASQWNGTHFIGAPAVSFPLPRERQQVGWTLITLHAGGAITSQLRYLALAATAQVAEPPAGGQAKTGKVEQALQSLGPIAVLPMVDRENHVLQYFRALGAHEQLKLLEPAEVIDPERFNPQKYKLCLYLSSEQYQRTAEQAGDIERALRAYLAGGGALLVLSTGPYPFYLDEKGREVISGSRFGLNFLGNEEQEETVMGFDEPPEGKDLAFVVHPDLLQAWDLPERLPFPSEGERRWRPLVRVLPAHPYEAWISLRDGEGNNLGEAAAWLARKTPDGGLSGQVAFVTHLLTQTHPQRDEVLDAVFSNLAGKLAVPAEPAAAPEEARSRAEPSDDVSDRVHLFYYNWYGAPPHQKQYVHWQQGGFVPPDEIGANFYPLLGAYSSSDPKVLDQHMQWIRRARVGVLSLSWWGQRSYEERHTPAVLDAASRAGLKVNFHLEPYDGSTPESLVRDIAYLLERYGSHSALHRPEWLQGKPLFYVFRALSHAPQSWRQAIQHLETHHEPVVLIAQTSDLDFIKAAGFDGGYVYDVLTPFRSARFFQDWVDRLGPDFKAAGKLFIPSVGPGYWDDRAMPRGADEPEAARTRDNGRNTTYRAGWKAAMAIDAPIVTITSFNEWHEGSQIEPAVARETPDYRYPAYEGGEMQYIDLTAELVEQFMKHRSQQ